MLTAAAARPHTQRNRSFLRASDQRARGKIAVIATGRRAFVRLCSGWCWTSGNFSSVEQCRFLCLRPSAGAPCHPGLMVGVEPGKPGVWTLKPINDIIVREKLNTVALADWSMTTLM